MVFSRASPDTCLNFCIHLTFEYSKIVLTFHRRLEHILLISSLSCIFLTIFCQLSWNMLDQNELEKTLPWFERDPRWSKSKYVTKMIIYYRAAMHGLSIILFWKICLYTLLSVNFLIRISCTNHYFWQLVTSPVFSWFANSAFY